MSSDQVIVRKDMQLTGQLLVDFHDVRCCTVVAKKIEELGLEVPTWVRYLRSYTAAFTIVEFRSSGVRTSGLGLEFHGVDMCNNQRPLAGFEEIVSVRSILYYIGARESPYILFQRCMHTGMHTHHNMDLLAAYAYSP